MSRKFNGGVSRRKFLIGTGATGAIALAGCTQDSGDGGDGSSTGGDGGSSDGGDGGDGSDGSDGGDGGDGSDGSDGSDGGDMELSGNIRVSGSSTVFPVATAVGELFQEQHPEVSFDISRDGSSGGFENVFIPGDSDINNSSRRIGEDEVQAIRDNGFEPVEFLIGRDALTVVVNNDNDWVEGLTFGQLEQIWQPDGPEMWSDVNSDWPDEEFDLYGAATTSGTFDFFTETILGEEGRIREDFEGTEEDDLIAEGVQGNTAALGYLPFAYYTNNPDETRAVPLAEEEGQDFVEPSLEAAASGDYALARPLFFYANDNMVQEKSHLQEFISFYIEQSTREDLMAQQIGYVPSSDDRASTNTDNLEQAINDEYEHPF